MKSKKSSASRKPSSAANNNAQLVEDELAERDKVKSEVYLYYAKAVGVWMSASGTLCYALFKGFEVAGIKS